MIFKITKVNIIVFAISPTTVLNKKNGIECKVVIAACIRFWIANRLEFVVVSRCGSNANLVTCNTGCECF